MNQSVRTEKWIEQQTGAGAELVKALAREHVAAVLLPDVWEQPQAQLVFGLLVNLLARLSPVVQRLTVVVPADAPLTAPVPRWRHESIGGYVRTVLQAVNASASWTIAETAPDDVTLIIAVGRDTAVLAGRRAIYLGSQGWDAAFSPAAPVITDGSPNPVGAYAAACIGAAEVWKRLLGAQQATFKKIVPIVPLERDLTFSTLTYEQRASPNLPLPELIDIGLLCMVGVGAGGGAAAYTLASITALTGSIVLIDPDEVEYTNLNRYVFADQPDASDGRHKVDVLRAILTTHAGVAVKPIAKAFRAACGEVGSGHFRRILAAVHSREARRDIQHETPEVLWDCGAAEHGEFKVWRLRLGVTECMFCKHPRESDDGEYLKAQQIAPLLGLNASTILDKIRNHSPFTEQEASEAVRNLTLCGSTLTAPVVGQRFNDWEAAQCGNLKLQEIDDTVPIPFSPVMAGVLAAGEIIKEVIAPAYRLDSSYENTLLGSFSAHRRPERRRPRQCCPFCTDRTNLEQFRRRWV